MLAALRQHVRQFVDSPSLKPWRGIAADTGIAIQAWIAEIGGHVQAGVRLALHGQQFVRWTQMLFKNRYAERVPEQIAIFFGEPGLAVVSKRYHRMTELHRMRELEAVLGKTPQLLRWACDGRRMEACRLLRPAGRKNPDQLGLPKTRRQNSRARSRIHWMYEKCARFPAPDFYDHGTSD
jgi:hypothetical protein